MDFSFVFYIHQNREEIFLHVLRYIKPYRFAAITALFCMLVELGVELLHPLFMAKIIDEGIMENDLRKVLTWGGIMLLMSLLAFASGVANSFIAAHVSQGFGHDVRHATFSKVQSLSVQEAKRFPAATLVTRLTSDVSQLQNTLFMSLRIAMRAPLLLVGSIVMACILDLRLAFTLLVTVPPLFLFLWWMLRRGRVLFRGVQEKLDNVNSVMRFNVASMRFIRGFSRRTYETKRFDRADGQLRQRTVTSLRTLEATMPVLLLIMNTAILVILWFGGVRVSAGDAQVGEVVAIVNYALRITSVFSVFSFIIMAYSRAFASAGRIGEVLAADQKEEKGMEVSLQGSVAFRNVFFRYPDTDSYALQEVSFAAGVGQTIAIMGETGAGKTTLLQLLVKLYDVKEGDVYIDGYPIQSLHVKSVRQAIGMVPQESLLFTGSIRENIAWGNSEATNEEIIQAAKDAQIHDTIINMPHQYDSIIGQRGVNLSGGQKQRVAIARALVRKPKLLLLDDSTSALDTETESRLLTAIQAYHCTTLLITQKVSTARRADRIVLLENGRVVAQGTHGQLLRTSQLYRDMHTSQLGGAAHV
ncbi:ABC transporter ATP-binding protein [Ectobacillus antri]|uniref:ABC transporter ATP-binding protein n=1 Tax=Ectobacillus antri TaxID=2486280 RepID=UPI000F59540C